MDIKKGITVEKPNLVANITFGFEDDDTVQVNAKFVFRRDGTAEISLTDFGDPVQVPSETAPEGGRTDSFLNDFLELFAVAFAAQCGVPPMFASLLVGNAMDARS